MPFSYCKYLCFSVLKEIRSFCHCCDAQPMLLAPKGIKLPLQFLERLGRVKTDEIFPNSEMSLGRLVATAASNLHPPGLCNGFCFKLSPLTNHSQIFAFLIAACRSLAYSRCHLEGREQQSFSVQREKAAVCLHFVFSFSPLLPVSLSDLHFPPLPLSLLASCFLSLHQIFPCVSISLWAFMPSWPASYHAAPTSPCELFQAYSGHFHPFLWSIISCFRILCLALG